MKKASIDIDNWNNIPVPLVNSSKAFKKSLENQSNVTMELVNELRNKTEMIVRQFKKVEKDMIIGTQGVKKSMESNQKILRA